MPFDDFCNQYCVPDNSPVALDYSRIGMPDAFIESMEPLMQTAFAAMRALEAGSIANPDENRMVGHYWLREFDLIPDSALRKEAKLDFQRMLRLVEGITQGRIRSQSGKRFVNQLVIGIGGSALGPQLVSDALGRDRDDKLKPYFLDNTDPEGIERVLYQLDEQLDQTLCIVISKSGGTPETRNGMLLAEDAYRTAKFDFGAHAVAITGIGSKLDSYAKERNWIARLPMYDWVGGRTSVMSAVGLFPAGLQGISIGEFLEGARQMDVVTRSAHTRENPAALLALSWHHVTDGRGAKDMVVLPYRDRLLLFSRYLQQLVMESLGKAQDLDGRTVEQGIAVYGNKGSTDQHAYVQQLRDGVNNFFAVFIEVLRDGGNALFEVEPGVTAGDYLSGFHQGTRRALAENGRRSLTITIGEFRTSTLGALIALFERAVGLYASLVNINAYHQPGVEAGKKAAAEVLDVQRKLLKLVAVETAVRRTAREWAERVDADPELTFKILQHLAYNSRSVTMRGRHPKTASFGGE